MKRLPMTLLLAAMLGFVQAEPLKAEHFGRTAQIFSTVGHSEFCPPGNVLLDVRTGRYTFTPKATRRVCNDAKLERPIQRGRLKGATLAAIQGAYRRVLEEGFESQRCRDGAPADEIFISNGGTPLLVLTTGRATFWAPEDYGCWNDAANSLHNLLATTFRAASDR